jgi:hypothetical protein
MSQQVDKSPELNLFASLCGLPGVRGDIHNIYSALLACRSLGEVGWAAVLALLNIVLGGNAPVPDLVSPLPPGYIKYVRRIELVSDKEVKKLLPDIPFPKYIVIERNSDKEGKSPPPSKEVPLVFGIYIEYEHPAYGLSRSLWVIYDAGTGDYPFRAFLAPSSVAETVGKKFEQTPAPGGSSMLAVIGVAPGSKTREKKTVEKQAEPTQQ